ncbi:MAG: hypothetical protein ACOCTL_00990 [Candidatus Hadarchaeota archaeon]
MALYSANRQRAEIRPLVNSREIVELTGTLSVDATSGSSPEAVS